MTIEQDKDARQEAIASVKRCFRENIEEDIGNMAAGALLKFFLEEIGLPIYNQAVSGVQERLQARGSELDIEVQKDELPYWRKNDCKRQDRK